VISGVICIAASIYFSRQFPSLREIVLPIYDRMGLLTEHH
jgi:hypothetical protein